MHFGRGASYEPHSSFAVGTRFDSCATGSRHCDEPRRRETVASTHTIAGRHTGGPSGVRSRALVFAPFTAILCAPLEMEDGDYQPLCCELLDAISRLTLTDVLLSNREPSRSPHIFYQPAAARTRCSQT